MLPPPPPPPPPAAQAKLPQEDHVNQQIKVVVLKGEKATLRITIPIISAAATALIMLFAPGLNILGFAAVALSLVSMAGMRLYRGIAFNKAFDTFVRELSKSPDNLRAYAKLVHSDNNHEIIPEKLTDRIYRKFSGEVRARYDIFSLAVDGQTPSMQIAPPAGLPPALPAEPRVFSVRFDSGEEVHYEQIGTKPFAHGGMCELYKARVVGASISRDLAVKVLMPDLAKKPTEVARFQQEAKVCALPALAASPYFIPFHGSGTTADKSLQPFIVMDLLDPETYPTLDQRIALPYIDRKDLSIPEYQKVRHLFVDPPTGPFYVFRPETNRDQIAALSDITNPTIIPALLKAHDAYTILSNPGVQNQIGAQLTFALWFLAQQGYAHKDIKPSQVFVSITRVGDSYEVNVRLSDFGAAKSLVGRGDATETGHLMGTMTYMAPEYIKANKIPRAKRTTAIETAFYIRMDIYSLGASLFKMFSGQVPFDVTDPKDFLDYMYHPEKFRIEHPLDLRSVPEAWQPIITKMLMANPRDRYQNYEEVFVDIRARVGDQFIPAEYGSEDRGSSVVSLSELDIVILEDRASPALPPAPTRPAQAEPGTMGAVPSRLPARRTETPVSGVEGTEELSLPEMDALVAGPSGSRPSAPPAPRPAAPISGRTTDLELDEIEEAPPAPRRPSAPPAPRPAAPRRPAEELEFDDEGWGAPALRPAPAPGRRPPIVDVDPADLLPAPAADRSESSLCLGIVDHAEIVECSQAAIIDPVHALRLTTILERLSAGSISLSESSDRSQVVALRELLGQLNEIDDLSDAQGELKDQVILALQTRRRR